MREHRVRSKCSRFDRQMSMHVGAPSWKIEPGIGLMDGMHSAKRQSFVFTYGCVGEVNK